MQQENTRLKKNKPELLAPAGDWEALRAACANGADAVYFGLNQFNARSRAHNFQLSELRQVMDFLHSRNVKGFVTLNILIFSDELESIVEFIRKIAEANVDAVIVQDIGLVRLIKQLAPDLHIHASTQMTLTEPRGIEVATQLGLDRVVLARELSAKDIRKVTQNSDVPVEVFVHGALCVAYSGQCLTSEALGGRSANRGQCAQACRLPYQMIVDGQSRDLGDRSYLLSPQDLAAYSMIDDLIDAGVISFKIEGRLKGGPYVAAATQTYRQAIDAALTKQEFNPSRQQELELAQTFSRGFTTGFLTGNNHQRLVRGRFPKSRGVRLGHVAGLSRTGVVVDLAESIPDFVKPGDGLLFDLGTPDIQEPAGRVWHVNYMSPRQAELKFEANAIDYSKIGKGCTVWKTDDPAVTKKLQQSYSQDKVANRQPISATISGQIGGAVSLELKVSESKKGQAVWQGPLEQAKNRPTTVADIREQLGRLGDTPFSLDTLNAILPDQIILPRSVLNDLRRQAVSQLLEALKSSHAIADPNRRQKLLRNTQFSCVIYNS
jgi:U32 family peptidase